PPPMPVPTAVPTTSLRWSAALAAPARPGCAAPSTTSDKGAYERPIPAPPMPHATTITTTGRPRATLRARELATTLRTRPDPTSVRGPPRSIRLAWNHEPTAHSTDPAERAAPAHHVDSPRPSTIANDT